MDVDGVAWDPDGPSQQIAWDEEGDVPGFGVRVYPSGAKSFVVWVRNRESGRKRLVTIGRIGTMTLDEARAEARQIVERHRNPSGDEAGAETPPTDRSPSGSTGAELAPTQVLELLAAIDQETNPYVRAALRVCVQTDLSRDDLLRALWSDLDVDRGALRIRDSEDREEWNPLPAEAVSILEALPRRADNPYIFCGRYTGSHVSDLWKPWRDVQERAGIQHVELDALRRALKSRRDPSTVAETSAPSREQARPLPAEAPGPDASATPPTRISLARSSTIGIEISAGRLRAYRAPRGRQSAEAMEVAWGDPVPSDSVEALRQRYGSGNVLAVALDMAFIHVKRLELPPLSAEERQRMISLDSRRYFPILDEDLIAGVRDDDLVIAASAAKVDAWVEALGVLGTVERVEAAPSALARHLGAHGSEDAVLVLADRTSQGATLARLGGGTLEALRKVPPGAREVGEVAAEMWHEGASQVLHPFQEDLRRELEGSVESSPVVAVPPPAGAPEVFAVAAGAALGVQAGPDLTLTSPVLAKRLTAARRRRAFSHIAALLAAVSFLAFSLDQRRNAVLESLDQTIAASQDQAAEVLQLGDEAASIRQDLGLLAGEIESRTNPMDVLLELTRTLPEGAYLTQLSSSGEQWEINGLAEDAASLIPLLEQSTSFSDVRFRTATTRVRLRGQDLENFSVVLRHVPAT